MLLKNVKCKPIEIKIEIEMQLHKKFGLIVTLEVCQWVWKSDR